MALARKSNVTTHACDIKINNRKKCVTFLRGGGGSPQERPYDVSRGQNQYVTLPLVISTEHPWTYPCMHGLFGGTVG